MAAIQLISTTIIQARSHVNHGDLPKQIELNPWDLRFLLLEYAQKGILYPKPTMSLSPVIQHLKDSLSCTLNFFLPLAGRLAIVPYGNDGTASVFVTCNNAGVSFVHAIMDNTTMSDILEPTYVPPIVESFFPLGKSKNFEGIHIPLMAVQVTELVDGICIAFSMNHCLVDGMPILDVMNTWANISRNGLNHIGSNSKLASFERWFPHGNNIERPIRIPLRDIMENYAHEYSNSLQIPQIYKRIFHFKKEKIAELKAKANSEVKDGVLGNKISSLQAVISHVWRCAIKNLHLDREEEVGCSALVSARSRISSPPIPNNYFGNTLKFDMVTMKVGDLVGDKGHGKFALEMNKVVSSYTEEKIKSDFEALIPNPTVRLLSGKFGKVMNIGGSRRTNFYAMDFGWGRPLGVRRGPSYMYDWESVLDGGAEEDSIDIELCMSYEILELLGKDPEFMHAVSPPQPPAPQQLPAVLSTKRARGRL